MVLKVNNLSLPLQYTPTGPVLSTEDKYLSPIAWVVNSALDNDIQQIVSALASGENFFIHQLLYAVRPTPADEDLEEGRAQWHELTGEVPGEDLYIVGTGFSTHRVVLPRQTLQQIIQGLLKLRAEFPEPPFPWLFRTDPYHLTPTYGEEELVGKLEERAAAFIGQEQPSQLAFNDSFTKLIHDLEQAGLFSEVYSEEKQYWLELWGFTTLLDYHRAALAFFNYFRQKLPTVRLKQRAEKPLTSPPQHWERAPAATPSFALSASLNTHILAV